MPAAQVRRVLAVLAVVALAVGLAIWTHSSPASARPSVAGSFTSLAPARLLDTRYGTGAPKRPVAAHETVQLQVAGRGGVPASGVSAVALNVTATGQSTYGYVTAWGGGARPTVSNLNYTTSGTVANLVVTPVAADGTVSLYNGSRGTVALIADVSGYYLAGTPRAAGTFASLRPARLLDTRNGTGPVATRHTVELRVGGRGGVPDSGVSAVALHVTATVPSSHGYVTVWGGGRRPTVSSLNYKARRTAGNLVVAPVASDGTVQLYNGSDGTVQLIADVSGYYLAGGPLDAGGLGAVPPYRMLDTRSGVGASGPVGARSSVRLHVAGRGWVLPSGVSAVVLNVTATGQSTHGYVTVWAGGTRPRTSSLNYTARGTVANLVVTPVRSDGTVALYNGSSGTVQLVADVAGFVLEADRGPAPAASTSRYVRNLTDGGTSDVSTMHSEGCADATDNDGAGPYLNLLHIGAQSQHPPLSVAHPGVALTGFSEDTTPRLEYPELVTALEGYLDGYVECRTGAATVTLAIGTNNDGDFVDYTAAQKGTDWATQVIEPLRTHVANKSWLDVVAANDIEAGFASTEQQAEQWETAYLDSIPADDSADLVFTGSADACPTVLAPSVSSSCGAVVDDNGATKRWWQASYFRLAHALSPGRILALPQIYVPAQAWQWASIALHDGVEFPFLGALTEHAAVPALFTSEQGWGALWDAMSASAQVSLPAPPVATDLQIDYGAASGAREPNAMLPNG